MKQMVPAAGLGRIRCFFLCLLTFVGTLAAADPVPAPDFTHHKATDWINSAPLRLADLRGQVVLIDVWTFECWNCYR